MRSFRQLTPFLLVPVIAACGGGSSKDKPDAFVVTIDAPADAPPPPPGCDFGELRDDSNDDAETTGSPEDTALDFSKAGPTSPAGTAILCGKFNNTHFTPPDTQMGETLGGVDADAYSLTFPADTVVYVSLSGSGLEALGEVTVQIYGGQGFSELEKAGTFAANHAAVSVPLDAGTYEIYVTAANATAPGSEPSYKVKIETDAPNTRCAHLTTGGYAEAHDGTNSLGNDMIGINDDAMTDADFATFTALTTDVAEPTALTIDAMSYRMNGGLALNPVVGTYKDRDTYEITTGANTNEIALRTDWTGAADVDMVLFNKPAVGAAAPDFWMSARSVDNLGPGTEYLVTAVKPNTAYWVWVGTYNNSTAAAPYDISVCGKNFTPPN